MRVYILTDHVKIDDTSSNTVVLGPVSSKQAAIKTCETYLNQTGGDEPVEWKRKEKHNGYIIKGNHNVTYQMFFVNFPHLDVCDSE